MSLAHFKGLISDFGAKVGIPGMAVDNEGYIAISFDDRAFHLQYETDTDRIVVFVKLGEVEVDRIVEIYSMMLAANMFWQGTNGATFSVEPDTGTAFLADRREVSTLNLDGLSSWLEGFINISEYWAKKLDLANIGGPIGDGPSPDDGGPSLMSRFMLRG